MLLHDVARTAHAVENAAAAKRELQHHARHHSRENVADAADDRPPGAGGTFPIQIGGGFLYNTYPYVSCMYPACILKDTCIPNVS